MMKLKVRCAYFEENGKSKEYEGKKENEGLKN